MQIIEVLIGLTILAFVFGYAERLFRNITALKCSVDKQAQAPA